MAQRTWDDILRAAIDGTVPVAEVIRGLFDRSTGMAAVKERGTLDFKRSLSSNDPPAAGEIARDILAFSNTEAVCLWGASKTTGGLLDTPRSMFGSYDKGWGPTWEPGSTTTTAKST